MRQYEYTVGSFIGDYLIKKTDSSLISGLQVVSDPGFLPVIISFMVIISGLVMTLIQKMGDKKL